jgi:flavin-dependent dehydrogenase
VIKKEFGEGKMNGMTDLKRRRSGFDEPHNGIICKNGVKSDCTLSPAEIIRAKYLVACDGAHSWTRKYFEVPFRGQATDSLWGEYTHYQLTWFEKSLSED